MSRVPAKPRCTPPIPPVPRKLMPAILHAASVPPTVTDPSAPWTMHAAMSRGPALRALVPDSALRFECHSETAFRGKAVRHQGGFQRHHRPAVRERRNDLVGHVQRDSHGIAPIVATALAAAARPRWTPPTRYPAANASPAPVASAGWVETAG